MFYLMTHATHLVTVIWRRTYGESGNQQPPHGILFPISSKGSFICTIPQTGRGVYYPVCGMMHIKELLLLIGKSSPCGSSGFPLSLS